MIIRKAKYFSICFVLASVLTSAFTLVQFIQESKLTETRNLAWSRAIANSVATLSADRSLDWAVSRLNGTDSTSPYKVFVTAVPDKEIYSWSEGGKIFDYSKRIEKNSEKGIRILLPKPPTIWNWFQTVFAFLLSFSCGMLLFRKPLLVPDVSDWAKETSDIVSEMGVHIKEVIKNACELVKISDEARIKLTSSKALLEAFRTELDSNPLALPIERNQYLKENLDSILGEINLAMDSYQEFFKARDDINQNVTNTSQSLQRQFSRLKRTG